VSTEDLLVAQMAGRASALGISYFAFTANPQAKDAELFGCRPNPNLPAGPDNSPAAFRVYSMRQAIEEGFILDVLQNYTTYKLAFKLAHDGKEWDDCDSVGLAQLEGWLSIAYLLSRIEAREMLANNFLRTISL
jgi:type I restriction enzyme, R subunit